MISLTFYISGGAERDLRDPTRHQVQRGCGRTNKRLHSRGGISECVDLKTFHPYWHKKISPKKVKTLNNKIVFTYSSLLYIIVEERSPEVDLTSRKKRHP